MDNKTKSDNDCKVTTDQRANRARMKAAFERVQNPHQWKAAINVVVYVRSFDELAEIGAAVMFYTATKATAKLDQACRCGGWTYIVTAPGYWAGPAA